MTSYYPMVKNSAQRIVFPILDNDGDLVTGAAGLDSEVSIDGGTFADCTNEATQIATSSGMYYLDLIAAETNGGVIAIIVKTTTTDAKTTALVFYTSAQSLDTIDSNVDAIKAKTDSLTFTSTNVHAHVKAEDNIDFGATKKASINTEADTALSDYDPPTKTEMDSGFAGLNDPTAAAVADAVWDEAIADHTTGTTFGGKNQKVVPSETVGDYKADVSKLDVAVSTRAPANEYDTQLDANVSTRATPAQVDAEVDEAIENYRLDELMIAALSAQPTAESLFADLTEDDGGQQRFNANALEQAPTGGTNPNVLVSTTIASVTSQTEFTLTAGSNDDDAYNDQAIVVYDASESDFPSVRKVSNYVAATKTITIDSAPDFTIVAGDGVKIFVTAPGTTAPTAAENADAVWDEAIADHATGTTFGGKNQKVVPSETIGDYKADVSNLDVAVSTRAPSGEYDTQMGTGERASATALATAQADLDNPSQYKADVSNLDVAVSTRASEAGGNVAAIKAKTDNLPTDPADDSDIDAQLAAIQADLDNPAQYKADVSALALEATLTAMKGSGFAEATDSLEALRNRGDSAWITATGFSTHDAAAVWAVATRALTEKTGFSLSAAGIDAILDEVVETLTMREIFRVVLAALAGKSAGGGGVTLTFRDYVDSKNRISATVDENGNRTAMTLDAT